MAKKAKKFIAVVMTIFVAAALVFIPSLVAQDGKAVGEAVSAEIPVYSVKTGVVETRTLEAYLEVNGDIVSEGQVAVLSETAGKLVTVKAALGTRVRQGDLIAQVDPSSAGSRYMVSSVYAPISGIVCAVPLAIGSTVQAGSIITSIAQADDLQIEALIPEREVSQLRVGLTATVTLPAFQGEVFTAKITQVSPILDPASRTKKIVLRFEIGDNRINAGMFAHVKLNTRTYPNVVTVPSESIIEKSGTKYVYGFYNSKVELKEVVTGVTVDYNTEIKSGLVSGDAVVIQGQQFLSNGAAVLVRK
ncbi:efflux RND transporter periplasmic adaptor subunit [Treponema primitia]|uniref:efflux RND transporter periplasmic adaptor subunit n=1 Tax=Treponema primitia TaxID=88058 RepID=UPI0002555122|nr:efflux RND transporter periplasmic adaptor subunit [Treponema primitia]